MQYDIVMVTYNSEKWPRGCVQALASAHYPKDQLHLVFADNASGRHAAFAGTAACRTPGIRRLYHCARGKNVGFGAACNAGAQGGPG